MSGLWGMLGSQFKSHCNCTHKNKNKLLCVPENDLVPYGGFFQVNFYDRSRFCAGEKIEHWAYAGPKLGM